MNAPLPNPSPTSPLVLNPSTLKGGFKTITILVQLVRVITTLTRPFSERVLDFIYLLFMGRTKVLPPIDDRILLMSATELAQKIRKKQLSCVEVMSAYVSRCRTVHPYINAAVDERYEDALKDAKAVDAFLASGDKSEEDIAMDTPLLGVPFTCKECIGVKDMAQTSGIPRYKDRVAKADSDPTSSYRKAGAIPLTVTNVPEFCMWWESANHIFGMTKNPYDNRRSVGGSSGGEGSIITSAAAVIGIGNDIAGSVRLPASFCGIYGHKPTNGIVSNEGNFPEEDEADASFMCTGPMCRYAQDLPLLVRLLTNNDNVIKWDTKVNFKKVKVYYMEEIPGILYSAVPEIKAAIRKAVRHFEGEYGVKAIKVDMEEMRYAFRIWECKLLECGMPPFKFDMAHGKDINLQWEMLKNLIGLSSEHTQPALYFALVDRRDKDKFYHECLQRFEVLKRKFEEILEGDAIFLIPTQSDVPPHYLMTIPKYPNLGYTCIFNILGYPSTQIPTGLCNGIPIGIQAVSRQFQDHLTLAAGVELDKVFGGWVSPCPVNV